MRTVAMQQLITKLSKSKKNGKDAGFSLIELLVVVLIIGILAAIAVPVFLQQQDLARASAVQSDLTTAKIAIVSCQASDASLSFADCTTDAALLEWGYQQSGGASAITGAAINGTSFDDFCLESQTDATTPAVYSIGPVGGVTLAACPA